MLQQQETNKTQATRATTKSPYTFMGGFNTLQGQSDIHTASLWHVYKDTLRIADFQRQTG